MKFTRQIQYLHSSIAPDLPIESFIDAVKPTAIGLEDKSQFYAPIRFTVQVCGAISAPAGAIRVDVPVHANSNWLSDMKSRFAGMIGLKQALSNVDISFKTVSGKDIATMPVNELPYVGKLNVWVGEKKVRLPNMPQIPVEYSVCKEANIQSWLKEVTAELPELIAQELCTLKSEAEIDRALRGDGSVIRTIAAKAQALAAQHVGAPTPQAGWGDFLRIHHMNSPDAIDPKDAAKTLDLISKDMLGNVRRFVEASHKPISSYLQSLEAKQIAKDMAARGKDETEHYKPIFGKLGRTAEFTESPYDMFHKIAEDALASPVVHQSVIATIYNRPINYGCRWTTDPDVGQGKRLRMEPPSNGKEGRSIVILNQRSEETLEAERKLEEAQKEERARKVAAEKSAADAAKNKNDAAAQEKARQDQLDAEKAARNVAKAKKEAEKKAREEASERERLKKEEEAETKRKAEEAKKKAEQAAAAQKTIFEQMLSDRPVKFGKYNLEDAISLINKYYADTTINLNAGDYENYILAFDMLGDQAWDIANIRGQNRLSDEAINAMGKVFDLSFKGGLLAGWTRGNKIKEIKDTFELLREVPLNKTPVPEVVDSDDGSKGGAAATAEPPAKQPDASKKPAAEPKVVTPAPEKPTTAVPSTNVEASKGTVDWNDERFKKKDDSPNHAEAVRYIQDDVTEDGYLATLTFKDFQNYAQVFGAIGGLWEFGSGTWHAIARQYGVDPTTGEKTKIIVKKGVQTGGEDKYKSVPIIQTEVWNKWSYDRATNTFGVSEFSKSQISAHHPWNAQIHHTLQPLADGVYPTYYNLLHTKQDMSKNAPYSGDLAETYKAYHMFAGLAISPPGLMIERKARVPPKGGRGKSKAPHSSAKRWNEDDEKHMKSALVESSMPPLVPLQSAMPPLVPLGTTLQPIECGSCGGHKKKDKKDKDEKEVNSRIGSSMPPLVPLRGAIEPIECGSCGGHKSDSEDEEKSLNPMHSKIGSNMPPLIPLRGALEPIEGSVDSDDDEDETFWKKPKPTEAAIPQRPPLIRLDKMQAKIRSRLVPIEDEMIDEYANETIGETFGLPTCSDVFGD